MRIHLLILTLVSSLPVLLRAQTVSQREFSQLTEQHNKAMAAATDPLVRRYQASLEQLLRRATQAGDLETALKIKEALKAPTSPDVPTTPLSATARPQSRRELEKLVAGDWYWGSTSKWVFIQEGGSAALDRARFAWTLDKDRVMTLTDKDDSKRKAKLIFTADLTSFTGTDFDGKTFEGSRRKKQ